MAKFDSAEKLNLADIEITDVMTGDRDKRMFLYYQLIHSLKKAERVDIIVSFLMESGVKMLLRELGNALDRGAKIRILTGNYLGITQPSALYLIKQKLGDRVDLRFYNEKNRSFHPKSYIFHYADYSEIYIQNPPDSEFCLCHSLGGSLAWRGRDFPCLGGAERSLPASEFHLPFFLQGAPG